MPLSLHFTISVIIFNFKATYEMPGSYLPRNLLTFFNYPPSGTLVVKFQSRGRLVGYWQRQDSLTPSATRWNSRSTWTRQCLAPHRVNSDWIYLDRYS
ncbi:hypothetical protein M8J76_010967 [Diaphorina citri]|nr:hypothetical protein M8J75_002447 [Diaphorina citri]KAI5737194.1 hypothetical protein M8J76_010967 [Diaphorina citri]